MAKPVLYYTARSPPCRSVLLTAAALRVDLELRPMNLEEGDHLTAEFLKLNPQHTIPVLDDNGIVVADSHVICSYLAEKFARDEIFYPNNYIQRMKVDALLYYDCGHLFPRSRLMVEPILYFGADNIGEEKISYMQKAYDGLEKNLASSKYLCGEDLTIADLCCIATVSSAMLFAPIDEEKFPNVKAWVDRLSELPYYKKNNQEGVDTLYKFVEDKIKENKKLKAIKN